MKTPEKNELINAQIEALEKAGAEIYASVQNYRTEDKKNVVLDMHAILVGMRNQLKKQKESK